MTDPDPRVLSQTPEHLMSAGLFNEIAMNLSGGEWRTAGLVGVVREIRKGGGSREQWTADPNEADLSHVRIVDPAAQRSRPRVAGIRRRRRRRRRAPQLVSLLSALAGLDQDHRDRVAHGEG